MKNITFNKLYEISASWGEVPKEVINECKVILTTAIGISFASAVVNDVEWVWLGTGGNLPKRIAKAISTNYKPTTKLEKQHLEKQVSIIGQKAKAALSTKSKFYIDFVKEVDWHPGYFGDGGSCFFSERQYSVDMLRSNGIIAARFWEPFDCTKKIPPIKYDKAYEGFAGTGRIWMGPSPDSDADGWVIFNLYSTSGITLLSAARMLSDALEGSYSKVRLTTESRSEKFPNGARMYINNSETYLIHKSTQGKVPSELVNTWSYSNKEVDAASFRSCVSCREPRGSRISGWKGNREHPSQLLCPDCVTTCSVCKREWAATRTYNFKEYSRFIADESKPAKHEHVCAECISSLIQPCQVCRNLTANVKTGRRKTYCTNCVMEEKTNKCPSCKKVDIGEESDICRACFDLVTQQIIEKKKMIMWDSSEFQTLIRNRNQA